MKELVKKNLITQETECFKNYVIYLTYSTGN